MTVVTIFSMAATLCLPVTCAAPHLSSVSHGRQTSLSFSSRRTICGTSALERPSSRSVKRSTGIICELTSTAESTTSAEVPTEIPEPLVMIDQTAEAGATVVELEFGDRLGALLDTTKALKDLGLNVVKAKVTTSKGIARNRFVITRSDNGQKVEDAEMLEQIRLTIINNLIYYHPESRERLAPTNLPGLKPPSVKEVPDVRTKVEVETVEGGKRSVLHVETGDRPGLIVEIVKLLGDLSINVESAEIDTQGPVAKDQFYVTYRGEALNSSMREVISNTLHYFLERPSIEAEESY